MCPFPTPCNKRADYGRLSLELSRRHCENTLLGEAKEDAVIDALLLWNHANYCILLEQIMAKLSSEVQIKSFPSLTVKHILRGLQFGEVDLQDMDFILNCLPLHLAQSTPVLQTTAVLLAHLASIRAQIMVIASLRNTDPVINVSVSCDAHHDAIKIEDLVQSEQCLRHLLHPFLDLLKEAAICQSLHLKSADGIAALLHIRRTMQIERVIDDEDISLRCASAAENSFTSETSNLSRFFVYITLVNSLLQNQLDFWSIAELLTPYFQTKAVSGFQAFVRLVQIETLSLSLTGQIADMLLEEKSSCHAIKELKDINGFRQVLLCRTIETSLIQGTRLGAGRTKQPLVSTLSSTPSRKQEALLKSVATMLKYYSSFEAQTNDSSLSVLLHVVDGSGEGVLSARQLRLLFELLHAKSLRCWRFEAEKQSYAYSSVLLLMQDELVSANDVVNEVVTVTSALASGCPFCFGWRSRRLLKLLNAAEKISNSFIPIVKTTTDTPAEERQQRVKGRICRSQLAAMREGMIFERSTLGSQSLQIRYSEIQQECWNKAAAIRLQQSEKTSFFLFALDYAFSLHFCGSEEKGILSSELQYICCFLRERFGCTPTKMAAPKAEWITRAELLELFCGPCILQMPCAANNYCRKFGRLDSRIILLSRLRQQAVCLSSFPETNISAMEDLNYVLYVNALYTVASMKSTELKPWTFSEDKQIPRILLLLWLKKNGFSAAVNESCSRKFGFRTTLANTSFSSDVYVADILSSIPKMELWRARLCSIISRIRFEKEYVLLTISCSMQRRRILNHHINAAVENVRNGLLW